MNASTKSLCRPERCDGAALISLMLMVVIAFSAVLVTSLLGSGLEMQRRQKTLEALAQAKQALIAWSAMQGDTGTDSFRRPGTLPCPDTNFFGGANSGNAAGSCSSAGGTSIGRLPWKSLGTDRLRDATGETLWYAVSDKFRNPNLNSVAINSDSTGSLLLYAADGSSLVTPSGEELAAIIIAPGLPLPGQDRATLPNASSSFLESFNGKNNANANGPFIMGPATDGSGTLVVNDIVVGITARELILAAEQRAMKEAQNALGAFAAANGHFPNPAPFDGANCTSTVTNVTASPIPSCASDSASCFGRLPEDVIAPHVATWFLQNAWGRTMTYAISDGNAGCATPLYVDGASKSFVLIAPGTARNGQNRPSTSLSDYLEDSDNTDAWLGDPNFSTPTVDSNDQLRSFP